MALSGLGKGGTLDRLWLYTRKEKVVEQFAVCRPELNIMQAGVLHDQFIVARCGVGHCGRCDVLARAVNGQHYAALRRIVVDVSHSASDFAPASLKRKEDGICR